MISVFLYIFFILLLLSSMKLVQSKYVLSHNDKSFNISSKDFFIYIFLVSPIILLYSLRYGIGTDYFSYKDIFETLNKSNIEEYLKYHGKNIGTYYVEFGYYLLNRYLAPTFDSLMFICSFLMFTVLFFGAYRIDKNIDISFVVFIYLCTQFIYSMNGIRFAIAITIIFFGFNFIIRKQFLKWLLCILIASLFHKTSLICIPFFLLIQFKNNRLNKIRDTLFYVFILVFPVLINILMSIVSQFSFFSRYFSTTMYSLGIFAFKPMLLFHILPVILPMLLVNLKKIFSSEVAQVLFKISLLEIPLRMLGSLNTWLTRLTRFPQMAFVVLIPYVLSNIKNKKLKYLLCVYYICWYIFYFSYGAIISDAGDSLPYQSIIFN